MSLYEDLVAAWVPAKHEWLLPRPLGEELVNSLGQHKMFSYCACMSTIVRPIDADIILIFVPFSGKVRLLARAMVAMTLIDSDLCYKKYLVRIQIQLNHSLFNCLRTKRNNQHLNIFASGVRFLQSFCSFIYWRVPRSRFGICSCQAPFILRG